MGFDYDATAVIGVEVDTALLVETVRVRCCAHPEPKGKFCPECGKPAWRTEQQGKPFCGLSGDGVRDWRESVAGLKVAQGLNDRRAYIGILTPRATDSDWSRRLPLDGDLAAIKANIKAQLEPLGLWREAAFGLWVVLGGG